LEQLSKGFVERARTLRTAHNEHHRL
jgi:hypothetical protein